MHDSLRIAVLYGGRSVEHVVSCRSAATVCLELHKAGHVVIPICISREGMWSVQPFDPGSPPACMPSRFDKTRMVSIVGGEGFLCAGKPLLVDLCFPVTHGSQGEDGMLQGLLELAHLAYVGCNPATSSEGMHKRIAKLIANASEVPTLPCISIDARETEEPANRMEDIYCRATNALGSRMIVKPEDGGSSVGITVLQVAEERAFDRAVRHALQFTDTVLVEPFVRNCLELECAVIRDGGSLLASLPGMVIDPLRSESAFLTYAQKYLGTNCAYMHVPAPLDEDLLATVSRYARMMASAMGVEGYARVDFLFDPEERTIWFNEINTLPGMTTKSHFPVLAASMGYDWPTLIRTLVKESLAREAHRKRHVVSSVE
ncbi:MAG: D-alanine--D-alanine ligase [Sphaerochaetaceae bacterium]|nr:D-alanine--D-alanine ligase [Sphaerochaetaceae bacterium]